MGEGYTNWSTEGEPTDSTALSEGGNTNRNIYAAPGSTEGLGALLTFVHQCMQYEKQTG